MSENDIIGDANDDSIQQGNEILNPKQNGEFISNKEIQSEKNFQTEEELSEEENQEEDSAPEHLISKENIEKYQFNLPQEISFTRKSKNIFLETTNFSYLNPVPDNINSDDILSDPFHPQFVSVMQQMIGSIDAETCRPLFDKISLIMKPETPRDIIAFILSELASLLKRIPKCSRNFVESQLHLKLPYYDSSFSYSTLSILHSLVHENPQALTKGIAKVITNATDFYGKQVLAIFSHYANSYEKVENPLEILDIMIANSRTFLDNKLSCGLVQVLFFLQTNFPSFQEERGIYCFYIYRAVCYCPDVRAVRQALQALALTYSLDYFKIENGEKKKVKLFLQTSLLSQLLQNALISSNVLNYMMKIEKENIEVTQELIENLLLHLNLEESFIILCRIIDSNEKAASFMLSNTQWLDNSTTKWEYLFTLFILIFSFKSLRAQLFSSLHFISFVNRILTCNDNDTLCIMATILESQCSSEEFVNFLRNGKFLERFFSVTSKSTDKSLELSGLKFFTKTSHFSIGDEALVVLPHFKFWIEDQDENIRKEALKSCIELTKNVDMKQALINHKALDTAKGITTSGETEEIRKQFLNLFEL